MPLYQYSISRYVENIARDEPINIGIIVNKPNTNEFTGKFVPDIDIIHKIHHHANITPLKIVVKTFDGEHKSNATLNDISGKSGSKLQFTDPLPIDGTDPNSVLEELYDDFISIVENFPKNSNSMAHEKARKVYIRTIDQSIKNSNIPEINYDKKQVFKYKQRKIKFDYVFKNGKVQDVMHVIPISASNPKSSRDAATVMASDYRHIKKDMGSDVQCHALIEKLGADDDNIKYYDLAKEDLEYAGCDTLNHDGIAPCLAKIKKRICH